MTLHKIEARSSKKVSVLVVDWQKPKVLPCQVGLDRQELITADFGEMKASPTECKEKCFHMISSACLHYSKAPQNVLMLMILLRMNIRVAQKKLFFEFQVADPLIL